MFEAQMLISNGTGYAVYSPWFPRGGDNLRATLEVVNRVGTATVTVRVFTKNAEDVGDGSEAGSSLSISGGAAGRSVAEWAGVTKQLVRYKFTVGGTDGNWTIFRMLAPVWFDSVVASA